MSEQFNLLAFDQKLTKYSPKVITHAELHWIMDVMNIFDFFNRFAIESEEEVKTYTEEGFKLIMNIQGTLDKVRYLGDGEGRLIIPIETETEQGIELRNSAI